jgi:hypothetical protein
LQANVNQRQWRTLGPVFNIEHLGVTLTDLNRLLSQIVGEGPMTDRSSTAVLSPAELSAALRRVADGRTKDVKANHLEVLFAMGLAVLDQNGRASLTIDGQQRLRAALAAQAPR